MPENPIYPTEYVIEKRPLKEKPPNIKSRMCDTLYFLYFKRTNVMAKNKIT